MDKSNRYRGLRANPQALGVTPLQAGELSRPVRVRASVEVHEWLRGFTSAELGQLLAQVYAQQQAQADTPTEAHRKPSKARATADKGKSTGQKRNNKSTKPISTE